MDVIVSATECRKIMYGRAHEWQTTDDFAVSYIHCIDMCDKIMDGYITGEKAHRWIGWLQACICINGFATLEELKAINKRPSAVERLPCCHSAKDGECFWEHCPQLRDDEPKRSGRHCPLDVAFPSER